MPIAPELLLLILGLPVAVVAATFAGGLVGRLVRTRLDGRGRATSPASGGPTPVAPVGATVILAAGITAAPDQRPVASPDPVPEIAATPGPAAVPATGPAGTPVLVDPEGARRIAGLPPPVATRVPSAVSPAMAARGGVPLTAGALGPEPEPQDDPSSARPVDRRVAAAPFALGGSLPRATAPRPEAGGFTQRQPSGYGMPRAARTGTNPVPRRGRRRLGLLAGSLTGIVAVAVLAATGFFGPFRGGEVLEATGVPGESGSLQEAGVDGDPMGSPAPGQTLGPVVPGGLTGGGAQEPGGEGAGGTGGGSGNGTGGGTGGGSGTGGSGGGSGTATPAPTDGPVTTPRPGGTPPPMPTATPRPAPTATPRATPRPTPEPTPDPTVAPTDPPPPTPDPTPAPTTSVKPPVADFNVTVSGLTVTIANRTKGATSWTWTFGDGTGSSARNPGSHTYGAGDTYTIRLVATGDGGSDTFSRTVTVGG